MARLSGDLLAFINPELVEADGTQREDEGCLSVPGFTATVTRPTRAVVKGLDRDGHEQVVEGTGLLARCFIHELDHLDGNLFVDRLHGLEEGSHRSKDQEAVAFGQVVNEAPIGEALRILFLGTPQFAVPTLEALLSSRHTVCGVVTQPDRPRGRGQQVSDAPVKALALARAASAAPTRTIEGAGRGGDACATGDLTSAWWRRTASSFPRTSSRCRVSA